MAQVILQNGAVPSTPSSGNVTVYSKTDKNLYMKDDTGTETILVSQGISKLPTIGCTQAGGALTFTASSIPLDFRSTTLTSGTISTIIAAPSNLVLPSGGTLGAVSTVSARIIVVELNNAGTAELAIVNIAGGNDLSETGIINTTAIGAGSTANNVFYSTTARTGVAYRVIGFVDVVNTAGTWGNPTLVQGAGGQSFISGVIGQSWQAVVKTIGTTYYNTSGKTRQVSISYTNNNAGAAVAGLIIGGVTVWASGTNGAGQASGFTLDVPPGMSYVTSSNLGTMTLVAWSELG